MYVYEVYALRSDGETRTKTIKRKNPISDDRCEKSEETGLTIQHIQLIIIMFCGDVILSKNVKEEQICTLFR